MLANHSKGIWLARLRQVVSRFRGDLPVDQAKDRCIAELRRLLSRDDRTEFEAALPAALAQFPRATLRLLESVQHQIPEVYARVAATTTFTTAQSRVPRSLAARRSKWPSGDNLAERAQNVKYLCTQVLVPSGSMIRAYPAAQLRVFTFGSCFAQHLSGGLTARGIHATTLSLPDQANTTGVTRTVLQYLTDGRVTAAVTRVFGSDADATSARDRLRAHVRAATHIVLTVGVAPTLVHENGEVSWRMTTPRENADNLREAIAHVRALNADADICLTLSPVPLGSSFSTEGVVHDDVLSKAVLRVALADVMSSELPGVHYWPSFEAVKWLAAHSPWSAFGEEDGISRHPSRWLVDAVLDAYSRRITVG